MCWQILREQIITWECRASTITRLINMKMKERMMVGSATLSMYMHGKGRSGMNDGVEYGAISVMKGTMG